MAAKTVSAGLTVDVSTSSWWVEVLTKYVPPAAVGGWLLWWWRRPRLRITFDSRKTYDTVVVNDLPGNPWGYFCHFIVSNDGRSTAKGCRARLMTVSRIEGEGERPVTEFRAPRTLKWANEPDFGPRDITPGLQGRRRADLCMGIDGATFMHFMVPPEEQRMGVQTAFPKGHYRLRVSVEASNAATASATLDVRFSGTWNQIHIEQVG